MKYIPRNSFNLFRQMALTIMLGLAFCCTFSGCLKIIPIAYLLTGPPSVEPDFDKQMGVSMKEPETTVAVVVYAPEEVQYDNDNIDHEISTYVTNRLNSHDISVIRPEYVHQWLEQNPDWDIPTEIGAHFETDYVIYIDITEFGLYEKKSHNLYRGRTEAMIHVYEMDDTGEGEKIYSKELTSKFPTNVARDEADVTYNTFKGQYMSRLSEQIGRHFYEYYNGDDIPFAN